jgi:hypothetical protein
MKTSAKKIRLTLTIDHDLHRELRAEADVRCGGNISKLINELIRETRNEGSTMSVRLSTGQILNQADIKAIARCVLDIQRELSASLGPPQSSATMIGIRKQRKRHKLKN